MNCSLNWSFISCGELHCDSAKIKTMINSSLFSLRQCESLDWSDCLVVLLLSATHFRKSGHARIKGVFLIFTVFSGRRFLFSLPAPSPLSFTCPISSSLWEVSIWLASKLRLKENACTAGYVLWYSCFIPRLNFLVVIPRPESSLSVNMQVGRKIVGAKVEIVNCLLVVCTRKWGFKIVFRKLNIAVPPPKLL